MAGRPLRTALILELEKRTREYFDIEPEKTHLDYACERIANGTTIQELAEEISASVGMDVGRPFVSRYLHTAFAGAAERLEEARTAGAGSMVEEALGIVKRVDLTREAIQAAKLQADQLSRTAGWYDRARYGSDKAPTVSISISGLHLDALRLRPVEVGALTLPQAAITSLSSPAEESPVQEVEYQVLSE